MTGWQALSVATLGVSAAIAAGAVGLAAAVWFHDGTFLYLHSLWGASSDGTGARIALSVFTAAAGLFLAYYLLAAQQWLASHFVIRKIRFLRREFTRLENERGTEAAARWLCERLPRDLEGNKVELFGGPTEALLAEVQWMRPLADRYRKATSMKSMPRLTRT